MEIDWKKGRAYFFRAYTEENSIQYNWIDDKGGKLMVIENKEGYGIPFKNDHYLGQSMNIKNEEGCGIRLYTCSECGENLNVGQCHRLDPSWEGVYCPSCGHSDPPLKLRSSNRRAKT